MKKIKYFGILFKPKEFWVGIEIEDASYNMYNILWEERTTINIHLIPCILIRIIIKRKSKLQKYGI